MAQPDRDEIDSIEKLHSLLRKNKPADALQGPQEGELCAEEAISPEDTGRDSPTSSDVKLAVGLLDKWNLVKMYAALPKLFALPAVEEETTSPAFDAQEPDGVRSEEEEEEPEPLTITFQSKYLHIFPLYQDYCAQAWGDGRTSPGVQSSTQVLQAHVAPQCLASVPSDHQSRPEASCPPPHVIEVTPCSLWQDLDEVKAAGFLSSLTTKEILLQESMFELMGSEASYLKSLRVAVDHFYASGELKGSLSPMEHHILFSNILQVKTASEKFLMSLEIRLGENVLVSEVGDVVLKHCPAFHSLYVPYVTNMMYQEALMGQLLQNNREFVTSLRKLEADAACQRRSLKSFLVLPFQRITRIKLLLENILKRTAPDQDAILNLEKAIEALHEILAECNARVKKMKQIEELVCLEMQLDFGPMKAVPLVVSGRFLVHQGPVRQLTVDSIYHARKAFISIYLHLFNDLLVISSKKEQMFVVLDHADFPARVQIQHLKTELLGLPPESFLLHLSKSWSGQPTALILVPSTRSDKDVWVKVLTSEP